MKIKNILLDMDGVIADFFGSALVNINNYYPEKALSEEEYRKNATFDMAERFGISKSGFLDAINYEEFWSNLDIFPWAQTLYNSLNEIAPVTIASSPIYNNDNCIAEKLRWLKRHFGINSSQCMFGSKKYLMAKDDVVLIDDYRKNVDKFKDCGGYAILVPSSWNTDMSKVNVVDIVSNEMKKIND